MMKTYYYLDGRKVDKKDIPKKAILYWTNKTTDRWGGKEHKIFEKYYQNDTRETKG